MQFGTQVGEALVPVAVNMFAESVCQIDDIWHLQDVCMISQGCA